MNRKVSILIPCHNAEKWIEHAVESSLSQKWHPCEVIVIDDGSTDDSPKVLDTFQHRARIIKRENRGGNQTRNELLGLATGDWIQFLDADDYLLADKVSEQMKLVEVHPDADVVYSPQIIEQHGMGPVLQSEWNPHDPDGDHDAWSYHLGWELTQTGGALFRRTRLNEVGGWNEAQSRCQDNELYFRLLKDGARFYRSAHAGSVYRRFDGGSVSTSQPVRLRTEILRLLKEGEAFLSSANELTARRLQAINDTRFRLARGLYGRDKTEAKAIMACIHSSNPKFRPSPGEVAPANYRAFYRFIGFSWAEEVAALLRRLRS